jgi:hypothetical protein
MRVVPGYDCHGRTVCDTAIRQDPSFPRSIESVHVHVCSQSRTYSAFIVRTLHAIYLLLATICLSSRSSSRPPVASHQPEADQAFLRQSYWFRVVVGGGECKQISAKPRVIDIKQPPSIVLRKSHFNHSPKVH